MRRKMRKELASRMGMGESGLERRKVTGPQVMGLADASTFAENRPHASEKHSASPFVD